MALEITSQNYKELIESGKPLVIDFWAEWCGPCRMVSPIIDELAQEFDGQVVIGKCDICINPIYISPAPGIKDNINTKNLLFFLCIIFFLAFYSLS